LSFKLLTTAYLFLGLIQAVYSLFLFFLVLVAGGWSWGEELSAADPLYRSATGVTLASIILMQVGNVVGRRSLSHSGLDSGLLRNRVILLGIALELVFSWAILYWPPLQSVLRTGPVMLPTYALAWLGVPLLFLLDAARKRLKG
jgi:sodium/potassium-transporting ATPase subunit alpha